jgi:hypothetical protein
VGTYKLLFRLLMLAVVLGKPLLKDCLVGPLRLHDLLLLLALGGSIGGGRLGGSGSLFGHCVSLCELRLGGSRVEHGG